MLFEQSIVRARRCTRAVRFIVVIVLCVLMIFLSLVMTDTNTYGQEKHRIVHNRGLSDEILQCNYYHIKNTHTQ